MSRISKFKIITINGGAATGKSSTSKALAERLNLMHVDAHTLPDVDLCPAGHWSRSGRAGKTIPSLLESCEQDIARISCDIRVT